MAAAKRRHSQWKAEIEEIKAAKKKGGRRTSQSLRVKNTATASASVALSLDARGAASSLVSRMNLVDLHNANAAKDKSKASLHSMPARLGHLEVCGVYVCVCVCMCVCV